MELKKENDTLEMTLVIAEKGYPEAYHFLRNAYESAPKVMGHRPCIFWLVWQAVQICRQKHWNG